MQIEDTSLEGVKILTPEVYSDSRGFFLETWSQANFRRHGIDVPFVQDNWSRSGRGVLRGLHYQLEHPQGKLVRCTRGSVFDVAVDLQRSSRTFGRWIGVLLTEDNKKSLWIPPRFAHGFLALDEFTEIHYKCTDIYHPSSERTLAWDDPAINIDWPVDAEMKVQLSAKDQSTGCCLSEADCFQ